MSCCSYLPFQPNLGYNAKSDGKLKQMWKGVGGEVESVAKSTAAQGQLCSCIAKSVCEYVFKVHLLTITAPDPPLPLNLAWEKLNKQEMRRLDTSCLPSNRLLVPRSSTEITATATNVFSTTFTVHTKPPGPMFW